MESCLKLVTSSSKSIKLNSIFFKKYLLCWLHCLMDSLKSSILCIYSPMISYFEISCFRVKILLTLSAESYLISTYPSSSNRSFSNGAWKKIYPTSFPITKMQLGQVNAHILIGHINNANFWAKWRHELNLVSMKYWVPGVAFFQLLHVKFNLICHVVSVGKQP